jgi:thiamine-phosphate pyrophosphorylase
MTALPKRLLNPLPSPLLVITDRHQARHPLETIAEAVGRGGGGWLLLRDKDLDPAERHRLAGRLAAIARRYGMHFSVSRDVELAAEFGASVHLQSADAVATARRRLGRDAVIGVSAHDTPDVAAAAAAGADYVTLSPIFPTASKPGYGPALGIAAIRSAAQNGIAVLALGGVAAASVAACLDAGADGIAVMGEVMRAEDPGGVARDLAAACKAATARQDSTV